MRKLLELIPKENGESPVYTIALVEKPATERKLGSFKIGLSKVKLSVDNNMYVYASVLVPNQIIPRKNEKTGEEYDITFSEKTIARMAREFFKAGKDVNKWNSEHKDLEKLTGIYATQSWIVDDPINDKAKKNGLDVVKGEWCLEIEVEDEQIQKDIQSGKYQGISIEADMDSMATRLKKQENQLNNITMTEKLTAMEALLNFVKGTPSKETVKLSDETTEVVEASEEKLMMLEDGEYILEDGRKIVIREGMAEVIEVTEEEMADLKKDKEEMSSETDKAVQELAEATQGAIEKLSAQVSELVKSQEGITAKLKAIDETPVGESVKMGSQEVVKQSPFLNLKSKVKK